ncbi:hypothetical protein GGX14DRAFT_441086 [Mycena pura]|uniref:Diaminopimelate epimerase-like protein n=1 Tax=Mycena pura TaxID=153505 RepID=A0AAD6VPT5_9AGAR|nr:hypothetical protein GGX14DRAFT_441086 [Mycena pura]
MNGSLSNSEDGRMYSNKTGAPLYLVRFAALLTLRAGRLEFQTLNAFTQNTFGGNPAAIVFLQYMLPDDVLEKIKDNFNQPIIVYVSPPKPGSFAYGLRWFGPRNEVSICGHGTLAAAEAIFRRLNPAGDVSRLEFDSKSGRLTAERVEDKIRIELPAATTVPASAEETLAIEGVFARALGKPGKSVGIRYAGFGGPGFKNYLLVEVEVEEGLSAWKPMVEHFVELAPRTQILVVTSASRKEGIAYETRMFAPTIGVREDHVCGSAHCLNAPYWAEKAEAQRVENGLASGGYTNGRPQHAKAVSQRGGDIWAMYFADKQRVQLDGNVKFVSIGMLDVADVVTVA